MPITDLDTLQKEMIKFEVRWGMVRPDKEVRNEEFIKRLSAALQDRLLDYFNGGDGSLKFRLLEPGDDAGSGITPDERLKRFEAIRDLISTTPFQVGATVFNVDTDVAAREQALEDDGETIKAWVAALQEKLLGHYRQAPENQRPQRLGEISFMFRSLKFQSQAGQEPIKIAVDGVDAETNIADFEITYGGGCPPGTVCIDGNCV